MRTDNEILELQKQLDGASTDPREGSEQEIEAPSTVEENTDTKEVNGAAIAEEN